ncbi:MAG: multicopper oxidase family protein [Rhodospirillales bacterium]|nr:multicopper oxidase family protein [Rhodospirillales bacterium]
MAVAAGDGVVRLKAGPAAIDLMGSAYPKTPVWAYGGQVPGPELRYRQGERLAVTFENGIDQPSTIHWHGLRVPNAMDGVPGLTQAAVEPGETFHYAFDLPDAGTFWYHPHVKSSEQIGRGLYGPLIVEEAEPPVVDRDVTWVLDDWRVGEDARIDESFHQMHDMSHGGRLGNLASLNGASSEQFAVRAGERLRIRLINAANARSFALSFASHAPQVIALDGQPVIPFAPAGGRVVLGSGQRADLIIDMTGNPGDKFAVTDDYYARSPYRFLSLEYAAQAPLREQLLDGPIALKKNPIAVPDYQVAASAPVVISGGAMGGLRQASFRGQEMSIRDLVGLGKVWAINGIVADPSNPEPLLTYKAGTTARLTFKNQTAWPHPIHLHGHVFQILARNGIKAEREIWSDTVMLDAEEEVEVIFVADNPGDWLLHCHILEHHEAGMATSLRVG